MTEETNKPKTQHGYTNLLSEHDFKLAQAAGFTNTQLWNPFNQERFRNLINMIRREERGEL